MHDWDWRDTCRTCDGKKEISLMIGRPSQLDEPPLKRNLIFLNVESGIRWQESPPNRDLA